MPRRTPLRLVSILKEIQHRLTIRSKNSAVVRSWPRGRSKPPNRVYSILYSNPSDVHPLSRSRQSRRVPRVVFLAKMKAELLAESQE
jgi:hypothetical protein